MISVSRTVVVVFVPPSVVPASEEMSDRSLESLEPSSDVRSVESLSLPKSAESVLRPVVEDSPRSEDAVRPVPSVLELPELEDELELEELLEEELLVETLPTESDGIEGMEGPEISGMLMLDMLWAASGMSMPSRTSVRKAVSLLQHRKLFFDHFKA